MGTIERLCNVIDSNKTFFKCIAHPESIVLSVGNIVQYTINSFVLFFILLPFNRMSTKCEGRAFVIECIEL